MLNQAPRPKLGNLRAALKRFDKMSLKEAHELAVVGRALNFLGLQHSGLRNGKQGLEPDCVAVVDGRVLGIEHTAAHYTSNAAKATWTAVRDAVAGKRGHSYSSGPLIEFDECLRREVQRLVAQKETKKYTGIDTLVLLVHMDAMLTEDSFIEKIVIGLKRGSFPSQFAEIWLGRYKKDGSYCVWAWEPKAHIRPLSKRR